MTIYRSGKVLASSQQLQGELDTLYGQLRISKCPQWWQSAYIHSRLIPENASEFPIKQEYQASQGQLHGTGILTLPAVDTGDHPLRQNQADRSQKPGSEGFHPCYGGIFRVSI